MDNHGTCVECGHNSGSTVCDTREVGCRTITIKKRPSPWKFWTWTTEKKLEVEE